MTKSACIVQLSHNKVGFVILSSITRVGFFMAILDAEFESVGIFDL